MDTMKQIISLLFAFAFSISIYSQKDENLIFTLKKHNAAVTALSFYKTGTILISGGEDKAIYFWDLKSGENIGVITNNYFPVKYLQFLPDSTILTASGPGVKQTDALGKIIKAFDGYTTHVWSFEYNEKVNKIVAGSYSNKILVWDYNTGSKVVTLQGHEKSTLPVCFSPDGKYIASGSLDRSVRLWDAQSGVELRQLNIHSDNILAVKFHPSGKYIASASLDKTVRLWDVETGKLLMTYAGHEKPVFDIDFSAEGYYLASGSQDNTVVLWDIFTGNKIYSFIDHKGSINVVKFSPEGSYLAAGSSDNTINIWKLNRKIFANYYAGSKIDDEISGSEVFGPKRKEESKQEFDLRSQKASTLENEIIDKHYQEYIKTRKNSFE